VADVDYIRESILHPRAKVVDGFDPIMPTFDGMISEQSLLQIVAYIKSLNKSE
jgi:cytochrome c oxidase subunit 2